MKIYPKKFILSQAILIFALAYFALSPTARAVCQEGCGGSLLSNTFLGDNALINNTSGFNNTAMGFGALGSNTAGTENTANGFFALGNSTGNFNTATGANALFSNTTGD